MYRIEQIKLPLDYTEETLYLAACRELRVRREEIRKVRIVKRSIDARKKAEIHYVFVLDVEPANEPEFIKKHPAFIKKSVQEKNYCPVITGTERMQEAPVIVGAGPAGLFCCYYLAKLGYHPILIDRGDTIENRTRAIEHFWATGELDPESNVQFGEGGAGTYSDGKLNTMVKDPEGRIREVLRIFESFGAPSEILYMNKPHIGTDRLKQVIQNMTKEIQRLGGTCMFRTRLEEIKQENGQLCGIRLADGRAWVCSTLILALGHSARDTFAMLHSSGFEMEKKAFAVGVRIEHPQSMISRNQYGDAWEKLPPADYKLTYTTKAGRGVYSFCMCPGGFVVNASSEPGRLAINGMSNYKRDEKNANSALIVTVNPEDFTTFSGITDSPIAGIEFQRRLEQDAFLAGNGRIPVQLYKDLLRNQKSATIGDIKPNTKGSFQLANLSECFPRFITDALKESIPEFGKRIPGFDRPDAVLSGTESRTSSPVRILRDSELEASVKGVYPCGEGAGYAGGIVSAAADGLRVAEAIMKKYKP